MKLQTQAKLVLTVMLGLATIVRTAPKSGPSEATDASKVDSTSVSGSRLLVNCSANATTADCLALKDMLQALDDYKLDGAEAAISQSLTRNLSRTEGILFCNNLTGTVSNRLPVYLRNKPELLPFGDLVKCAKNCYTSTFSIKESCRALLVGFEMIVEAENKKGIPEGEGKSAVPAKFIAPPRDESKHDIVVASGIGGSELEKAKQLVSNSTGTGGADVHKLISPNSVPAVQGNASAAVEGRPAVVVVDDTKAKEDEKAHEPPKKVEKKVDTAEQQQLQEESPDSPGNIDQRPFDDPPEARGDDETAKEEANKDVVAENSAELMEPGSSEEANADADPDQETNPFLPERKEEGGREVKERNEGEPAGGEPKASSDIVQGSDPFYNQNDSNFFSYFLFAMFSCALCYVAYHNKSKLLALLVEGRRTSSGRGGFSKGRKHTAAYRKLDSNLEEAITSGSAPAGGHSSSQIIY
ncbi:trans-Golgi network integral membrane protein 2-like [Anopheles bellator]|uniref:trans-Golgi network integral membrane protein 2-like n=1 Tax=Anopheles bellator TaxID=139047 RepID=UPI002648EEE5|nr:trans-Golgi network integral membrane protein 2-like [Anopheles bellator]